MVAKKKHGLGRGLEALLGDARPLADNGSERQTGLQTVPIDLIQPGRYQPRTDIRSETLEELANSIRSQGIIQPIVLRPSGSMGYEIIAGERRWRAAQLAELHEVPAIIKDVPDEGAVAMALIENIQREDLNPLEEARAIERLINEFELTHQEAAHAIGRSRAAVSNILRLLDLHEQVKEMLGRGDLEMGHARALLALAPESQPATAQLVVNKKYSVRETERLIRRLLSPPARPRKARLHADPNVRQLEQSMSLKLGARVEIQATREGKGKILIHYTSLEELEGILNHIQ